MSRKIRADNSKRVSSTGYQQVQDLEVAGSLRGPEVTRIHAAIAKLSAVSTTPVKLAAPEAEGIYKSVILRWTRQYNLADLDYYAVQVSMDNLTWYSLRMDGQSWGGENLGDTTTAVGEFLLHPNIPFIGTVDDPVGRTLYYRVRQHTKAKLTSAWSDSVSVIPSAVQKGDLAANSVYANSVVTGFLNAVIARITGELMFTADGIVGAEVPTYGAFRARLDSNEVTLEVGDGTTWDIVAKLGGDAPSGQYIPYLQAKGVLKTGAIVEPDEVDAGWPVPNALCLVWHMNNSLLDYDGGNALTNLGAEFASDHGYFGSHGMSYNHAAPVDPTAVWATIPFDLNTQSVAMLAWVEVLTLDTSTGGTNTVTLMAFHHSSDSYGLHIIQDDDTLWIWGFHPAGNNWGTHLHIPSVGWHLIGLSYNVATNIATLFCDGQTQSDAVAAAWGAGDTPQQMVGLYGQIPNVAAGTTQAGVDELMVLVDGTISAAEVASYYASDLPWSHVANYDNDLILQAVSTGKVRLMSAASVAGLASHANNAAAIAAGLKVGDLYRIGDTVGIVH